MAELSGRRDIKLIAIGNSKGIRIPKKLLQKYGWSDSLSVEEVETGLLLRRTEGDTMSWEETYRAMSEEDEDWGDLDGVVGDGLD